MWFLQEPGTGSGLLVYDVIPVKRIADCSGHPDGWGAAGTGCGILPKRDLQGRGRCSGGNYEFVV